MIPVSVAIITFNEESRILKCLQSVRNFAAEIVVVDCGSADATVQICMDFGCKVFVRKFDGFSAQKQFAVDQTSHDWVFVLDADEEVSDELSAEIHRVFSSEKLGPDGFLIPRKLYYAGRIMNYSGVGKERILRLFDRRQGRFNNLPVHESIETKGVTFEMKGFIIHYSFRGISHHLEKLNQYTTLAAESYHDKGRKFHPLWIMLKFPVTFFSFYILKLGFLDGFAGFLWSWMAAVHTSVKVAKTIELQRK